MNTFRQQCVQRLRIMIESRKDMLASLFFHPSYMQLSTWQGYISET